MTNKELTVPQIPGTGYLRLKQVLYFIPVGRSTWWKMCAEGKAPAPVKLGPKTTAWRAEDISEFIRRPNAKQKSSW